MSKSSVFDTLGGCLKGLQGQGATDVSRFTTQEAKALAPGPTLFKINKGQIYSNRRKESLSCGSFSEFVLLLRSRSKTVSRKKKHPADNPGFVLQFLLEDYGFFCPVFFHKSVFQKKCNSRVVNGNIIIENGNSIVFRYGTQQSQRFAPIALFSVF